MKLKATLITTAAVLAAAAPAQALTFSGPRALVKRAERWQREANAPLGREHVTLTTYNACPGDPAGCSNPGVTYARVRWAFYYEMGHQFDWTYLTDADRAYLARQWGVPTAAWADSTTGLLAGYEDGLAGDFPQWFEYCAFGVVPTRMTVHAFPQAPVTRSGRFDICSFIRRRLTVLR